MIEQPSPGWRISSSISWPLQPPLFASRILTPKLPQKVWECIVLMFTTPDKQAEECVCEWAKLTGVIKHMRLFSTKMRSKPLPLSSLRSSIRSREPHLHGERDLRHPGVVPPQGHRRQRGHHLQSPLQEVLRGRQEVRAMRQQRSLHSQTVRPVVSHGAGHRPAARLQLHLHCREPERGVGPEPLAEREGCHQRHNITDR